MGLTKYISRPVEIEATQWFLQRDHPCVDFYLGPKTGAHENASCGCDYSSHGWIDTLAGGNIVCPGDYIITGLKGEHYPCKPDVFHAKYQRKEPEE